MEENKNLTPEEEMEEMDAPELLTLDDGEGNEITFEIIAALDFNDARYVGVVEYVEDPEKITGDEQLVILKVGTDEEGEYYDVVEDDEELYTVGKEIEKLLSDEYEIQS